MTIVPSVWFWDLGFAIFPIVPGTKAPACRWTGFGCTRKQAMRYVSYGVPLAGLLVMDADSAAAAKWIATHVPPTPFRVRTGPYHGGGPGRGEHHVFRSAEPVPKFLHRDGLTIESRNARNQYVLGAGSRHPSGLTYEPARWSWRWDDIPVFPRNFLFDDRPVEQRGCVDGRFEFPNTVHEGERHDQLFRLLRSCKGRGWDRDATLSAVRIANGERCNPPLAEDDAFERWFERQWRKPDRPRPDDLTPEGHDRRALRRLGLRL